jgi:hypothetical protein
MKRFFILFAGFVASIVAALFWADSPFPLPPFSKFIWDALYTLTRYFEPVDIHVQEGILNFLGTWLALALAAAACGLALALVRHCRRVLAQPFAPADGSAAR